VDASTPGGGLFRSVLAPDDVLAATSDEAFVAALLEFERELAAAGSQQGVVPADAAGEIARACVELEGRLDPAELGRAGRDAGNPVVPLVRRIGEKLTAQSEKYLHLGATSQDALDTASMLVARRAGTLVVAS